MVLFYRGAGNRTQSTWSQTKRTTGILHPENLYDSFIVHSLPKTTRGYIRIRIPFGALVIYYIVCILSDVCMGV